MHAGHIDFGLMVLLGVTSSLHCVAMCGPLIAVASAPLVEGGARESARPRGGWLGLALWQGAYHLGRGLGYVIIGVVLAATGAMLTRIGAARTVGGLIQLAVGAVFLGLGLRLVLRHGGGSVPAGQSRLARILRRLLISGRRSGMLGLGLATALLPCGVLYAAFARSVAAGSPAAGGVLMLAFWAGTVPLLLGLGLASGGLFRVLGRHAAPILFVVMMTTGGWMALKGYGSVAAGLRAHSPCGCTHAVGVREPGSARLAALGESHDARR